MDFVTTFIDVFLRFWWIFPMMFFGAYVYYFFTGRSSRRPDENIEKEENKKNYADLKPEERFQVYDSDEKKYLDIDFDEKSVREKLPGAKQLILNLRDGKPFLIKSIEAVFIADKLSGRLELDDDGTLIIEKSDALRVAEMIQFDPQDLVRYILSMEKKLDPQNKKSKIKLADFLYLARNARNFNLLAYGSEPEKEETKALVKMKTKIYESWFENVQVEILNHEEIEKRKISENKKGEDKVIFEDKTPASNSQREHSTVDMVTGEVQDPGIEKVEMLENGHIKVYTKSRKIIEKDNFITYSYRDLVKEEEAEAEKNRKLGIKNNVVDARGENKLLNINPENVSEGISNGFRTTQADLPTNELALYESKFGALGLDEKKVFEKTRLISSLRFRLRKYYCEDVFGTVDFSEDLVTKEKFLGVENIFQILVQLFDVEFSEARTMTQRNFLQTIFIGSKTMNNNTEIFYRTVSADYFLSVIYGMMKGENKESFYQNVYEDFKNINEDNFTAIVENIHLQLGFNLFDKSQNSFLIDVIYSVKSTVIKTKILSFNTDSLNKILQSDEYVMDTRVDKMYNNWKNLKEKIGDSVKTVAFGGSVAKSKAQFLELQSEYFFRKMDGED